MTCPIIRILNIGITSREPEHNSNNCFRFFKSFVLFFCAKKRELVQCQVKRKHIAFYPNTTQVLTQIRNVLRVPELANLYMARMPDEEHDNLREKSFDNHTFFLLVFFAL